MLNPRPERRKTTKEKGRGTKIPQFAVAEGGGRRLNKDDSKANVGIFQYILSTSNPVSSNMRCILWVYSMLLA
jgi:hypothetical protein